MTISDTEIAGINQRIRIDTEMEYQRFKQALSKGECYLCGQIFSYISLNNPCIHWLVNSEAFEKRYFPLLYRKFSYWNIQSYLRWLANSETPFKNINDIVAEKNSSKMIENTIKYREFEWSFSSSKGDFVGHKERLQGKTPHYHFQMRVNGQSFINYGDFHIPFTDYDLWIFSIERGEVQDFRHTQRCGAGMQELFDNLAPGELLDKMYIDNDNIDSAPFELSTSIEALPGHLISGDDIAALIKESKETGVPMARLIEKLQNVRSQTIIMPGPGVPKIAGRLGGRK